MKILVCISHVPDTTSKINFSDDNAKFDTNGVQFVINPNDEFGLTRAMWFKEKQGAQVTVANVGGAETEPTLRKALAIGADEAIRVNTPATDGFSVAKQLASVIHNGGFDLVIAGRESIDYNGAQVAAMLGEFLDLPSISIIKKLELNGTKAILSREIEGGKEVVEVEGPFVASCAEGVAEWKIPNMRGIMSARTKPLEVLAAQSLETLSVVEKFETPTPRGAVKMVDAANVAQLVDLLHNEAKVI